jgi:hypothetical protein
MEQRQIWKREIVSALTGHIVFRLSGGFQNSLEGSGAALDSAHTLTRTTCIVYILPRLGAVRTGKGRERAQASRTQGTAAHPIHENQSTIIFTDRYEWSASA